MMIILSPSDFEVALSLQLTKLLFDPKGLHLARDGGDFPPFWQDRIPPLLIIPQLGSSLGAPEYRSIVWQNSYPSVVLAESYHFPLRPQRLLLPSHVKKAAGVHVASTSVGEGYHVRALPSASPSWFMNHYDHASLAPSSHFEVSLSGPQNSSSTPGQ